MKLSVTCEAEYRNTKDPDKILLCSKIAPYLCIFCNKNFCIDCMYLLCDNCHQEISCFLCGYPIKYEDSGAKLAKHYCNACKLTK